MKVCPVCQRCFEDEILACSEENHVSLVKGRVGSCEIIDNYRLDFLLESKAIGEKYLSLNKILEKTCVVKIFSSELFAGEAKLREQFLRETQDLSAVIHPNVVRVFERGMLADGSVYVVTEHFNERTLRDCLEQEGVKEVNALSIAGQLAEGLNAIHALGVLHRNIRPENIILASDAENRLLVKIQNIDFGGIRQKTLTPWTQENLSELRYFSPEQCAGKTVDAQTDVYALGIVLYEMLTGEPPFDAPDVQSLIHKQIKETPPALTIESFSIRALLTHTLMDSLQKTKRLRLKTANIFARRIRYIEQIATHLSTPPPGISYTQNELPDEILADLPTEELPPLESICGEFFFQNETETEQPSSFKTEKKSILLDWEQPDDVPPMPKILEIGEEIFAKEFASEPIFIDYKDSVIDAGEIDSAVNYLPEVYQTRNFAEEHPSIFSNIWGNFPERRRILMGAGVVILLVLAVGGRFLTRQFQIAEDTNQTIAQSSPNEISLSQTEKVLENNIPPAANPEEELAADDTSTAVENSGPPALPDYQPQENNEKKVAPIAQVRNKKLAVKATLTDCNCDKTIQNKPVADESSPAKNVEAPVKKVEVIIVGRKSAEQSKSPKSTEISIFSRPRIVKNPKF